MAVVTNGSLHIFTSLEIDSLMATPIDAIVAGIGPCASWYSGHAYVISGCYLYMAFFARMHDDKGQLLQSIETLADAA